MAKKRSDCCLALTRCLKLISTGAYSNGIYFKRNTYYSSSCGAVLTIIAFSLIMSYAAYVFNDLYNRVHWNVTEDYAVTNLTQFSNYNVEHVLEVMNIELIGYPKPQPEGTPIACDDS